MSRRFRRRTDGVRRRGDPDVSRRSRRALPVARRRPGRAPSILEHRRHRFRSDDARHAVTTPYTTPTRPVAVRAAVCGCGRRRRDVRWWAVAPATHPRVLGGEQSNSSVVYGDEYILKVFPQALTRNQSRPRGRRSLAAAGCESSRHRGVVRADCRRRRTDDVGSCSRTSAVAPTAGCSRSPACATSLRTRHARRRAGGDFAPESERLGE